MKQLAKKYSTHTIVGGLVLAFIWLQGRVQSILPAVMQDEYVYSMQARKTPLAELEYPNYLYSLVFSSTNGCGINYYSCAKNLNLIFFAGFVAIIFILTLGFLGKWWAFGISIATLLSPLGAYTSLFMPESMYFFFALLSLVGLLWAAKKGLWWQYLVAGALVGVTSLVKPHALFLAAGAVLFLLVVNHKSWKRFGIAFASYVSGTLVTKFALGFLIAGPNGLTLFGSNYTSSFNSFTEDLRSSGLPEGLSAGTASMTAVGQQQDMNPVVDFLLETIHQLGWQSAAVLLLAGGLIALSLGGLRSQGELTQEAKRFTQLVLISLGSMVLVIAAFGAMVTVLGDDHSSRLLLRYYEFLFAPLALAAIVVVKQTRKGNIVSYGAGVLAAVIGAAAFLTLFPRLIPAFADSPIMMGVTSSEAAGGLTVAVALGFAVVVFLRDRTRLAAAASLVIFSLVFLGGASLDRLQAQASGVSSVDSAGIFARDYLAAADPTTIFYVGANKQLTLASIFWLDKPNVSYVITPPLQALPAAQVPEGTEWVMTLDGTRVDVEPRFVINGQGWSLLNVSASEKHLFSQSMLNTPIATTIGFGPITNYGQWLTGDTGEVVFKDLVPAGSQMELEVLVGDSGAGGQLTISLGDGVNVVDLPAAGRLLRVNLDFGNTLPSGTIKIEAPAGTTEAIAIYSLVRTN